MLLSTVAECLYSTQPGVHLDCCMCELAGLHGLAAAWHLTSALAFCAKRT